MSPRPATSTRRQSLRRAGLCALGATLAATAAADAAAANPTAAVRDPVPVARRVTVPGALAQRLQTPLAKDLRDKSGRRLTASEALDRIDKDAAVKMPDGTTVTVQDLLQQAAAMEAGLARYGGLSGLKTSAFVSPRTATKIAALDQQHKLAMGQLLLPTPVAPRLDPCTMLACEPELKEKSITWNGTWGDEDTIAAYTSLTVTSSHPRESSAACKFDWDSGVYLLGSKKDIVRFVAEGSSSSQAAPTFTGKATLYVLGQSKWSKEGKVEATDLSRTFKTGKSLDIPLYGPIMAHGSIEASATLSLKPALSATATANDLSCRIQLTPQLDTKVTGTAAIAVGIAGVRLAEGGLKGEVVPVNVRLPTTLSVAGTEQPRSLHLQFQSSLDATMMKGRVFAYYKLRDYCQDILVGTVCVLEDILHIPTYGEYDLWKHAGYDYNRTLFDYNRDVPFKPVTDRVRELGNGGSGGGSSGGGGGGSRGGGPGAVIKQN